GQYKKLPIVKGIRHIPREHLLIKKNGNYKIEYSATSIHTKKIEIGRWSCVDDQIYFVPLVVKDHEYRAKKLRRTLTDCEEIDGSYFCKDMRFTFKNDTLWSDLVPWFVKE
ncbi:MAG: hypothetical protein AAFN93_25960, partial [Bacteroidota bacterium]